MTKLELITYVPIYYWTFDDTDLMKNIHLYFNMYFVVSHLNIF